MLSATDNIGGSGATTTSYWITVNGVPGSWTIYTGAFTLGSSANDTYIITWYSTDHVGNVEGTRHLTVYIDTIATTASILYTPSSAPDQVNGTTAFSLAAQDNSGGSGVAKIEYQYTGSGSNWILYTGPFTLSMGSNGSCTIMYRSTDNAGNVESSNTLIVILTVFPESSTPEASIWDQYGIWIIVAIIGVVIAIAVGGSVVARKKKVVVPSRKTASKDLPVETATIRSASFQTGTPEKIMTQPAPGVSLTDAGGKGTSTPGTETNPSATVNLYCPHCEQWIQNPADAAITGSETCPQCAQPLYFVPACDNCGNKIIKSVAEFTSFKNSSMACEKCGSTLRIQ